MAAGIVVSLIASFTTSLTHAQLVGMFAVGLVVCALVLGALEMPGVIHRRRAAFKAEVITAAKDAVLAELASQIPEPGQGASPAAILAAASASTRADNLAVLSKLLEEGRVLQARLGQFGSRNYEVPNDLAVEIARWEAKGGTALTRKPRLLSEFRDVQPQDVFHADTGATSERMEHQLRVLEKAARDLGAGGQRLTFD